MTVDDFTQLYISELQELRSVEDQLVNALPGLIDMAGGAALKQVLSNHLEETRLQRHDADPRAHRDGSMQAILTEAGRWGGKLATPDLRDAGLIASAQRVEHYEIAVYGTLATWAKTLGLKDDLTVLLALLEEEKAADAMLTDLAKRLVNPEAAAT